jgi:hypothetical protein
MKRNWDLLRKILDIVQESEGGYPVLAIKRAVYNGRYTPLELPDYDFGEVCEHILLLGDAGFALVTDFGRSSEGPTGVGIDRLTMAGHDFLSSASDNERWEGAMSLVKEKGGTVTVNVLSQILAAMLRKSFGLD